MSTENVTKFTEAVAASPELQAKVQSIHATVARDAAARIAALSAETDAPFTTEEFLAATRLNHSELSDEQLGAVAGGGSNYSAIYINTHLGCGSIPAKFGSEKGGELADLLRKDGRP